VAEADRARFTALFADVDFMQFSASGPLGPAAAQLRSDHMLVRGAEVPFGNQAVIESSTGSTIGYAGVDVFEYQGVERFEFGYRLVPGARGRGYATEAGRALLGLARTTFRGELLAFIDPENRASRRVLDKLGFGFIEDVRIRGYPVELYGISLADAAQVTGEMAG